MDKKKFTFIPAFLFICSFLLHPSVLDQKIQSSYLPLTPKAPRIPGSQPLRNIPAPSSILPSLLLMMNKNFETNQPDVAALSKIPKRVTRLSPSYWEIKIRISSSGDYRMKEGEKSNEGRYSFVLLWTGCMEQDQDDYLIYHENSELVEWEAREKVKSSEISRELSEKDFSGKPRIDFHYIIRKNEDLHFDFLVESFYVPQENPKHRFYLNLPASKENIKFPTKFDYNVYLTKGSNSIYIEEKDIYSDSLKKDYSWNWKHQKYFMGNETPISFSNSHKVKVTLTIIPHY